MDQSRFYTQWAEGLSIIARFYGIGVSDESINAGLVWEKGLRRDNVLELIGRKVGLELRAVKLSKDDQSAFELAPLLVEFTGGRVAVIEGAGEDYVIFQLIGEKGISTQHTKEQFFEMFTGYAVIARPAVNIPDSRVDEYIKPYEKKWFWREVLQEYPRYVDVMIAALIANILALAGTIFSMQIYDRVIPAQSETTLWVLFAGVMIAILFEFFMRTARVVVTDQVGKKLDLRLSDYVFGRALRIKNAQRPKSTGTFIAQIRELEQVREMITSTTLSAITDLPFMLIFMFVLWLVGGKVVFVVIAALPLAILPGLLLQKKLAVLARAGMREGTLRSGLLVETIEGIEDIKLMRAEARFERLWHYYNEFLANVGLKQRFLTALLLNGSLELQSLVYAGVLVVGSYLVMAGEMTTGALIASSILASRTIASVVQTSSIFARWQQAKVAYESLDSLVNKPVDHPESRQMLQKTAVVGQFELQGVRFRYGEEGNDNVLNIPGLTIKPGERIALLGRIAAGKSTLLQVLAGMLEPQAGIVKLDGLDLALLDPAVIRRDVGLLHQNSRLFFGTLRENLTLGRPNASDEEIIHALATANALSLVRGQPKGLDYMVMEGGSGLSGGQKQSLLLARTLLKQPTVLLLDEPTSSFDDGSEQAVVAALNSWIGKRTLVVATHKMAILNLVDRIVVLDRGKIVLDGSKDKVLAELAKGVKIGNDSAG